MVSGKAEGGDAVWVAETVVDIGVGRVGALGPSMLEGSAAGL